MGGQDKRAGGVKLPRRDFFGKDLRSEPATLLPYDRNQTVFKTPHPHRVAAVPAAARPTPVVPGHSYSDLPPPYSATHNIVGGQLYPRIPGPYAFPSAPPPEPETSLLNFITSLNIVASGFEVLFLTQLIREIQSERARNYALCILAVGALVNLLLVSLVVAFLNPIPMQPMFIVSVLILPMLLSIGACCAMSGGLTWENALQLMKANGALVIMSGIALIALALLINQDVAMLFVAGAMFMGTLSFFASAVSGMREEFRKSNDLNVPDEQHTHCKMLLLNAMDTGQVRKPIFTLNPIKACNNLEQGDDNATTLADANSLMLCEADIQAAAPRIS